MKEIKKIFSQANFYQSISLRRRRIERKHNKNNNIRLNSLLLLLLFAARIDTYIICIIGS